MDRYRCRFAGGGLIQRRAHLGPKAGGFPVHADEEELQAKIKAQVAELEHEGIDARLVRVGGPSIVGAAHMIAHGAREVGPI
jgi:hypothetical protein